MGFGYEDTYYFAALPVVRLAFAGGHFAVSTFFVISGYVLAVKPMQYIHSGDIEKLGTNLSSALFRRWIRLFVPVFATTWLWLSTWHVFGEPCIPFEAQPTYAGELWKLFIESKQYLFLYKEKQVGFAWLYWNIHTWSIPFEFKGSLTIYTMCLGVATASKKWRLLSQIAVISFFLWMVDGWYLSMFLSGMLLCDLDMLAAKGETPRPLTFFAPYKRIIWPVMLLASLVIGGVPLANNSVRDLGRTPGWKHVAFLVPSTHEVHKWFFLFWAATMLITSVQRVSWAKSFFEKRFCQYLGRVSYSLYLMHGPMIWTVGHFVYLVLGFDKGSDDYPYPWYYKSLDLSKAGPQGFELAFWAGQLVCLPTTLFVANVVTLLIDEPSVKLAAWVRTQTMPPRGGTTVEKDGLIKEHKDQLLQ